MEVMIMMIVDETVAMLYTRDVSGTIFAPYSGAQKSNLRHMAIVFTLH